MLQPVRIAWSEPVLVSAKRLMFADTLGDSVAAAWDTSYSDTTTFTPKRRLRPGRRYALTVPNLAVEDLAGLHPADTAGIVLKLTTIQADSLCYLFTGGADCLPPDQRRVWVFQPAGPARPQTCADKRGHFRFDSIPGSVGLLAWFSDRNGDGTYQRGDLFPWTAPEPWVPLYDTVEARANWDVENVPVRGCDVCERGQRDTTAEQPSKPNQKKSR